ncbi:MULTISPECIES: DUF4160 domain-containing protein [Aeromonas]|uniref:DUF4160 domain-containing protein n=1 Tax=Aeromonas TaxID=642 RepID=UPI000D3AB84A|nr:MULTISPECIES: DUF4160 domain-containing protein [Aeromonas]MBM0417495.1 DUF4160 domain-containing protein [Aeromonas veronii]MBW3788385.1 DUF4160 domain-containing protein [Aeromonas veronii]PTT58160.1 hypothetical protein DBR13_00090 [Aeromonas sp. HMWF015]
MSIEGFLLKLCDEVYRGEEKAQAERKRELFGNRFVPEFLLMRKDKVRVEIRKENVSHNVPHIHITHSDKIDVSISLNDFSVLAGNIDRKTQKQLLAILIPKKDELNKIWIELNEKDNSVGAEKMISNLGL